MAKIKIIFSLLAFFLVPEIHSQDFTYNCGPLEKDCVSFEYYGELNKNDAPHGEGIIFFEDGGEVSGTFFNGELLRGKASRPDGSGYEGEYKDWEPHGFGKLIYPDGSIYEGYWKSDKQHGEGILINSGVGYSDDGVYIKEYRGTFKENQMTGIATVIYSDGRTYEGKLLKGSPEGYGELIFPDKKNVYKGEWKKSKYHGLGVITNGNSRTEGRWKDGKKDGYFKISYGDGGSFEGFYTNDKRSGQGKSVLPDGTTYEGRYLNGMMNGYGELITVDGNTQQGTFKDNILVSGTRITKQNKQTYTRIGAFNEKGSLQGEGTVLITLDDHPNNRTFYYSKNFKNGSPTGRGVKQWIDAMYSGGKELYLFNYSGNLVEGVIDGFGVITAMNAPDIKDLRSNSIFYSADFTEIYRGEFKQNKYEGQGVFTQDLGFEDFKSITTGSFRDMTPHGKVTWEFENKRDGSKTRFKGNMVDGSKQGYGEENFIYEEATESYKGNFKDGRKWGKGVLTLIDNTSGDRLIIEGNFNQNSLLDGYGSMTYPSGAKDSGYFENGLLVEGTMTGALGVMWDLEPLVIESFLDDSPARASGLLIGDKILAVKGENSQWIDLMNTNLIRSPLRQKSNSQLDIKIQRKIGNLTEEKIFSVANKTIKKNRVKDESKLRDSPRIALIIGNSNYQSSKLDNPINDAELMKKSLEDKGFQTILKLDTNKEDFKRAVWEFGDLIEESGPNTTALFFYSGHGMQVNGENYLIPLGANIKRLREAEVEAISADEIMNALAIAENGIKIMILDACRDNPFKSFTRNLQQGLAKMDSPTGTIIAYSTAPGRTALDGGFDYDNSIYTKSLTESMDVYDLKIEEVFKRTRREVERTTEGDQVPWESSSLLGDFYFNQF